MQKVLIHANLHSQGFFTSGIKTGIQLPIDPKNIFGISSESIALGECEVPIGILSPLDHGYIAPALTEIGDDLHDRGYPKYHLVRRGIPLKYEFHFQGKFTKLDHTQLNQNKIPKVTWEMAIDAAVLSFHSNIESVIGLFDLIRPSIGEKEWNLKLEQHGWIREKLG
jgi:hypothetical protein